MTRFHNPTVLALSTTCHKCGRPVTVRVNCPTAEKIDSATKHAVCSGCWLSKSIRNPRHDEQRAVHNDS